MFCLEADHLTGDDAKCIEKTFTRRGGATL